MIEQSPQVPMWHRFGLNCKTILEYFLPGVFPARQHFATNFEADVVQVPIQILLSLARVAAYSFALALAAVFLLVANPLAHHIVVD